MCTDAVDKATAQKKEEEAKKARAAKRKAGKPIVVMLGCFLILRALVFWLCIGSFPFCKMQHFCAL